MENKKENFKRISENRVNKIITTLDQLTNLTNSSFYEYSNDDILLIFQLIENEVTRVKEVLLKTNDKNKKIRFKL